MAIEIIIPRLGWNMDEGVFVGWLKHDGDLVRMGDRLFTLEGEKATEDVESLDEGILRLTPDSPQAGSTVRVGAVVGYLASVGEMPPTSRAGGGDDGASAVDGNERRPHPARELPRRPTQAARAGATSSPRARRVAAALGVDWTQVTGSGRTGRIRERDVRAAAKFERVGDGDSDDSDSRPLAVSPARRTIAERLVGSLRSSAPVTLTTTADATHLVNLRQQFQQAEPEDVPSYTDFLVMLTARALGQHPLMNATWEGDRIVAHKQINIGIAVDVDAGLLVPVIRDVLRKTVRDISLCTRSLIDRARTGKLTGADMQGGTFSLTNLGAFGIDAFTPILNPPQCAILGVGRIEMRPAVIDGQVVPREQVVLSLTFDHRIVDGAPAARFLQAVRRNLEQPGPSLIA
jgi:pyruvate dehydrogenase E2 component (dihydrolipoamide acetyltransferase)